MYTYPFAPARQAKESIFDNVKVDFRNIYFLEGNHGKGDTNTLIETGSSVVLHVLNTKSHSYLKGCRINQGKAVL